MIKWYQKEIKYDFKKIKNLSSGGFLEFMFLWFLVKTSYRDSLTSHSLQKN